MTRLTETLKPEYAAAIQRVDLEGAPVKTFADEQGITANNAAVGGAFVPMMTLGIPGDAVTAIMIGALFIHGLNPGPMLMVDRPEMFWFIVGTLVAANCFVLLFGLTGIRQGTTVPASFRSNEFPHAAVNPITGDIYVTYNNKPAGVDKGDIFLVQSTDGGVTWGAPLRINDDTTTTDQWQPTLAVTPDGSNLGIFYYSRQEDPVELLRPDPGARQVEQHRGGLGIVRVAVLVEVLRHLLHLAAHHLEELLHGAERDDEAALVAHQRRHHEARQPERASRPEPQEAILGDGRLDRRLLVAPAGQQPVEAGRVDDRARQDVGADLGALLEDADRQLHLPLGRQLLEADRGGEARRAGADDHHVEGHALAFHRSSQGGSGRARPL